MQKSTWTLPFQTGSTWLSPSILLPRGWRDLVQKPVFWIRPPSLGWTEIHQAITAQLLLERPTASPRRSRAGQGNKAWQSRSVMTLAGFQEEKLCVQAQCTHSCSNELSLQVIPPGLGPGGKKGGPLQKIGFFWHFLCCSGWFWPMDVS